MPFMFEVYYRQPENPTKEAAITERVVSLGGRLDFREGTHTDSSQTICLTYEFADYSAANEAADELRRRGEYVEGPVDYGV
jgi:hypothetical protein